jgi:hypothetical protein
MNFLSKWYEKRIVFTERMEGGESPQTKGDDLQVYQILLPYVYEIRMQGFDFYGMSFYSTKSLTQRITSPGPVE